MSSTNATTPFRVPPDLEADWMSLEEACLKLSVTRYTVSSWCKEKILERKSYGRHTLISRASVEKYLNRFKPGIQVSPKPARKRK